MIMTGKNGTKMSNPEPDSLLLIDSTVNFSTLRTFVKKNPSTKVICFDYESYKILKNENISYTISDIFLDENERLKLQTEIFKFSKWYDDDDLQDFLQYEGINLGKLYYSELSIFLIPFLKFYFEIKKISEQYSDCKFFATNFIFQILTKLNPTSNTILFQTKSENSLFLFDYINFETNFLNIKLSKNSYTKFKNFSEYVLGKFSGINKKLAPNSILLVEFNTVLYGNLLLDLQKNRLNSIYFGIRRPSIWNSKSYSIIKQSRCYIATESRVLNNNLENFINTKIEEIKSQFKNMFSNDKIFNAIFVYDNTLFWSALKPFFEKLYFSRLNEAIKTIHFAKELLQKSKPSHIVVLSESGTTEQIIISLAKNLQIPITLIQHGVGSYDSKESDLYNEFTGSMPINSDQFFVWGGAMNRYAKNFGIPPEKIFVTGSCAHDNLFKNSFDKLEKDYILFSPEAPSNSHINEYTISVHEEYENILKKICVLTSKLNKKLVIKIHPHVNELNETKIAKSINPEIKVIKDANMISLIESCSLFITTGITSAMLDASFLNKPVIRIQTREWWGEIDTLRSKSAVTTKIDNLEDVIKKIFADTNFYEDIIENGKNFVNDCLSNRGCASKKISQLFTD